MTFGEFAACVLWPSVVDRVFAHRRRGSISAYAVLSGAVLTSVLLATSSLRFVSYPTKVVFKSCKLVPTMVVGAVMLGKSFSRVDVGCALLVCAGLVGLSLAALKEQSPGNQSSNDAALHGMAMLAGSIILDAITPNLQERLMVVDSQKRSRTTSGPSLSSVAASTACHVPPTQPDSSFESPAVDPSTDPPEVGFSSSAPNSEDNREPATPAEVMAW